MYACKSEPRIEHSNPGEAAQPFSFETHSEQAILFLYPERPEDSPRLILTLDLPELSGSLGQLIQSLIYEGLSPDEHKKQIIDFYENQYYNIRELLEEYPTPFPESLNWEYTEHLNISLPSSKILVLCQSWEYYLGGAHGMREKKYFVIDLHKVEEITLETLLNTERFSVLKQRIEDELRKFSDIEKQQPLSSGGFFEDTIDIPANFFLTSKGLGFYWDPYEIAPYVMGPIEIILPYTAIRDILSTRGKSIVSEIENQRSSK